jgi:diguanylate cyclase (GGDEF)-like protein/PAS domain S-box-containing protein
LVLRPRDGTHIHVHVQTVALPLSNGESHRWRSVMTNITDQKQAGEMIRRLSRAVEQSPASIVITDVSGNIEYVNPRFTQVTGYTFEEVLGKNSSVLKSDQTPAETHRDLWYTISGGREWKGEFVNRKKNGELYYELANVSPITDEHGTVTHYIAIKEDITERKFIADALQESNHQLIATLNALPDLMLEMTREGIVCNFHAARTDMLHARPRDFMNKDIEKSMPGDAARIIKKALAEAAIGGTSSGAVYSLEQPEGVIWYEVSITAKGDPRLPGTNFIMLSRDITDRKLAEKKLQLANDSLRERLLEIEALQARLREQAVRDHLTGLYNRHYLQETLDREIARALRSEQSVSIMIMDVDHFKRINDSHGHKAGDLVLRALGNLLKANIRVGDIPCRYGGEEFIIVMPDVQLATAHERAAYISSMINELQIPHDDAHLQVTVSVGVASIPQHGLNGEDVLLRADRALYRAKELGRNRIVLYEEGINPDTLRQ